MPADEHAGQARVRLEAARARLVIEHPVIGALALYLPPQPAAASICETVATDARRFHYNPAWIAALSLAEIRFVLAHEAMHCALGHFARRGHRVRRRWDVACDHAVNLLLEAEGIRPPRWALAEPGYRGMSAEEIYPLIPEDTRESSFDRHAFDAAGIGAAPGPGAGMAREFGDGRAGHCAGGDEEAGELAREAALAASGGGQSPVGSPADGELGIAAGIADDLTQQWRMRLASAVQQGLRAGRLSALWRRALDHIIEPELPWRALLARHLVGIAREDYSFRRPSRREGDAVLPGMQSGAVDLVVALDVSGSITAREMGEFAGELNALKGQVRARVTLLACDDALAPEVPWVAEAWEPLALPEGFRGGGGTDFRPVFEWVAARPARPDALIYFTDAQGEFPELPPDYPVIWLVKGGEPVPWGERIQLN